MKPLRLFALLSALAVGGCDGYFHTPAGETGEAARVGVTFRQVAGDAGSAFDAADNVAVEVRVGGATLLSESVAVTPGGSGAMAEVTVDLPEGATSARLLVELRVGNGVLFTGSATVNLIPGEVTQATVPLEPVVASLQLTGPPPFATVGETAPLEGRALFASGHEVPATPVAWESLDPGVVAVNASAQGWQARAVADGVATLRASAGGQSATVTAEVAIAVASIEVAPTTLELAPGETARLTAILRDAGGTPIAGRLPAWSTSDPAVAVVDAAGEVAAVGPGEAVITAALDGAAAEAEVAVLPPGPGVRTLDAVQITGNGAILRAEVDPRGRPATLQFQYALTPDVAAGDSTPPMAVAASESPVVLSRAVAGLPSGTRVYFRAVATGGTETAVGETLFFDTPAVPDAPSGLVASLADGVRLDWTAGSGDETHFEIERELVSAAGSGGSQPVPGGPARIFEAIATTPGGVTWYDDWYMPYGELRYRVRGCRDTACSAWTPPLTYFVGLPPAVVTLDAVISSTTLRLQALVNPYNAPTNLYWEVSWGDPDFTEPAIYPGFQSPLQVGDGNQVIPVQFSSSDVPFGYTLYIRAVASSRWGTSYGNVVVIETEEGW